MPKIILGAVYRFKDGREVRMLDQPTERSVRLIEQKSDGVFNRVVGQEFDLSLNEFSAAGPVLLYTTYLAALEAGI